MSDKYNGWTNFETWQANLWLTNDEGVWESLYDIQKYKGLGVTTDDVECLLIAAIGEHGPSLLSDITNAWLACVNLQEIADGFNEGIDYE